MIESYKDQAHPFEKFEIYPLEPRIVLDGALTHDLNAAENAAEILAQSNPHARNVLNSLVPDLRIPHDVIDSVCINNTLCRLHDIQHHTVSAILDTHFFNFITSDFFDFVYILDTYEEISSLSDENLTPPQREQRDSLTAEEFRRYDSLLADAETILNYNWESPEFTLVLENPDVPELSFFTDLVYNLNFMDQDILFAFFASELEKSRQEQIDVSISFNTTNQLVIRSEKTTEV